MATGIPAYICGSCGRGFTSARSARRHVMTLEQGKSLVYTEAQYRMMLNMGLVLPPFRKLWAPPAAKSTDYGEIGKEEFVRAYYRRLGEMAADLSELDKIRKFIAFLIRLTGI